MPFGKYELLYRIRVGGMAEVYAAREVAAPERAVAIKRILPSFTDEADYVEMFLDEARLGLALSHPNVVAAYELGQVGDEPYIALEYVPSLDLAVLLRRARDRREPLPPALACHIACEMCAALHYAHELCDERGRPLGIVHRDVSPQNVLLSYAGEVKLIDFGIAKSAEQRMRTQAGLLKGKHGYLSPEQARGEAVDRRSDVFSAGICLYEMLAAERLFEGSSDFSTLMRVREAEMPDVRDRDPEVPDALAEIVRRALARDREARYPSAAELGEALRRFMVEHALAADRDGLAAYVREAISELPGPLGGDAEPACGTGLLDAFDGLEPVSAVSALSAVAPPAPSAGATDPPDSPAAATAARTGEGGEPSEAPFADEPTRVVAYQSTLSGELAASEGAEPALQAAALRPPSAAKPVALPGIGVDWDDDDLSTQIYDPPEDALGVPALAPGWSGAAFGAARPPSPAVLAQPGEGAPPRDLGAARPSTPEKPFAVATSGRNSSAPPPAAATAQVRPLGRPGSGEAWLPRTGIAVWLVAGGLSLAAVGVPGALLLTRPSEQGSMQLTTDPADAVVTVSGERAFSTSPFTLSVEPEIEHIIEVGKPGYRSWSTRLSLAPGEHVILPHVRLEPELATADAEAATEPKAEEAPRHPSAVEVQLARAFDKAKAARPRAARSEARARPAARPRPEPPLRRAERSAPKPQPRADSGATGVLRINSRPWAKVIVDGRYVGNTPQTQLRLGAGRHTVALVNPEFGLERVLTVNVKADQTITESVELSN